MPTLEEDRLVFRFPQMEESARLLVGFQRTLRIPDTECTYSLPPGLGTFPLRHAEDYPNALAAETLSRGGVILPMWQAEAMWLSFINVRPEPGLDFPVAIKVAAGKINAVTGQTWRSGLHRKPQDYMVSPGQQWLDGFAVEKGVIRQFVAMPLGEGYSVEEQITGEAQWGGLQISVTPLKRDIWRARRAAWQAEREAEEKEIRLLGFNEDRPVFLKSSRMMAMSSMAMGAGGRMEQEIYKDTFKVDDWDIDATERVFITLVHAKDWKSITGEPAQNPPPTAKQYSMAGLPWFDYYGMDQAAVPGGSLFAGVKSVAKVFQQLTGAKLPDSEDVEIKNKIAIGPGAHKARAVRTTGSWEN